MKRTSYFLIFIVLILVFLAFKRHYLAPENKEKAEVLIQPEKKPIKEPLDIEGILQQYDSLLNNEIKQSGTVGAAVAVTYKNQIAYLKCFGVKKTGTQDSINENTVFRLASVSKTVSGVLAGILDEENVIKLDDKVVDYLPNFKLKNPNSTSDISIKNLLSHTSGLVPHAYDLMVEDKVPLKDIITALADVYISAPPGQIYAYQNVMFSLFDTIANVKTSKNYSQLLKEKLFEPLGMKNASADFQSFKNNNNKALPHAGAYGRYRTLRLNDRYYSTSPAAGVNASISDMANFLLALLNQDNDIVDNNIRHTVFTPQVVSPLSRKYFSRWDKVDSKQYAIGWRIVGYKGRTVAYHGGYVQGYRAEIALCEKENVGIVFLSNSPNSIASKSVPNFLNLFFDFKDKQGILTETQSSEKVRNQS